MRREPEKCGECGAAMVCKKEAVGVAGQGIKEDWEFELWQCPKCKNVEVK
jgi:hypothetical protein